MKKTDPFLIGQKYSKALFELGRQHQQEELLLAELSVLAQALVASGLLSLLKAPGGNKVWFHLVEILKGTQKFSNVFIQFCGLLGEMERSYLLPEIQKSYQKICDAHFNVVRGQLLTATDIDSEQIKTMQDIVTQKLGKTVLFEHAHRPDILGGVVAHVGGWTFDDSLKTHLGKLTQQLAN